MNYLFILLALIITLASLCYAFFCRNREKNTLKKLNAMLDAAIRGDFSETSFDESLLSALETRFSHYLTTSTVSSQNLKREKDKIKGLVSDISHQTKTPLSNILLYTQLLAEQELSPDNQICLSALETQTQKLDSLISALVKTSRLETGVFSLHPEANELFPMLEKAISEFRFNHKQISLLLEDTEESAVFDPKWTREAIGNLLDNAIKYTPSGGQISVRVLSYELFCRIDIKDNGIGIYEDEQAKIFSRFYRSERTNQSEGIGLGLYLVRQIVSRQGGYIKVSSTPNLGATFSLFLPKD